MSEIGRVLRSGGRACLSFYLLTNEWRERVANMESLFPNLLHEFQGCRVIDLDNPEQVIAYEKGHVLSMLRKSDLKLKTILLGSLSKPQEGVVQDVVLAYK